MSLIRLFMERSALWRRPNITQILGLRYRFSPKRTGSITTEINAIQGFMANITTIVAIMVRPCTRKYGASSTKKPVIRLASLSTLVIRPPVCLLL